MRYTHSQIHSQEERETAQAGITVFHGFLIAVLVALALAGWIIIEAVGRG